MLSTAALPVSIDDVDDEHDDDYYHDSEAGDSQGAGRPPAAEHTHLDWWTKAAKRLKVLRSFKNLHEGSNWGYLTAQQYKKIVHNGIAHMSPRIANGASVFEFGSGVGAVLKVLREEYDALQVAGSDLCSDCVDVAREVLPDAQFLVHDMTKTHVEIGNNSFDHVISMGAMCMYLKQNQMPDAVREMVRIVKPGGSLLISHCIEPGANFKGSIKDTYPKSYWNELADSFGLEQLETAPMPFQHDRYLVVARKRANTL
eukprot:gnl/TRDRNA2_/TRDRNA2_170788_c0_seq7.p1 gnl/TRDRNA2_/TRDRNA2_170788_c0~~gnl/TRDRNA2_/TRDRNA2_170788_c0_seq7.p1  ORF type:complete len:302 (+),score=23.59 gnl/TRDRNA2_/TRDRNA2_170788_c0_seq7:136-906(+)